MTGNASARARLGRLSRRNQGQNNQHNQYGPYHDDRSVYIHRACLARARTIPSMLCTSAKSGSSPTRSRRTLSRKPGGELLGILLLLRPLLLFFRIENPLHEKCCDQHEASPSDDGGEAVVAKQVVHHPAEKQRSDNFRRDDEEPRIQRRPAAIQRTDERG